MRKTISSKHAALLFVLATTGWKPALAQFDPRPPTGNIFQQAAATTPEDIARQYLKEKGASLGLPADALNDLQFSFKAKGPSGTVVRFRQQYLGLPVNDRFGEVTVSLNNADRPTGALNGYRKLSRSLSIIPSLSQTAAWNAVRQSLKLPANTNPDGGQLQIFKDETRETLVWRYVFLHPTNHNQYEVVADAGTGAVISQQEISLHVDAPGKAFVPDPISSARTSYGGGYAHNNGASTQELQTERKDVVLRDVTMMNGALRLAGPYAQMENPMSLGAVNNAFNFDRGDTRFNEVMCYYYIDKLLRYINTDLNISASPSSTYQTPSPGGLVFLGYANDAPTGDPIFGGVFYPKMSYQYPIAGQIRLGALSTYGADDGEVIIHELGHAVHDMVTNGGLSNDLDALSEGFADYLALSYTRSLQNWLVSDDQYNWVFKWLAHNSVTANSGGCPNSAPLTCTTTPNPGYVVRTCDRVVNVPYDYPCAVSSYNYTRSYEKAMVFSTALMKIWDDIGRIKADKAVIEGLRNTNASSTQEIAARAILQAAINMGYEPNEICLIRQRFIEAGYTNLNPGGGNAGWDIFMRDTPLDTGVEPNPNNAPRWESQDMWVRNDQDGDVHPENPGWRNPAPPTYPNGRPNYIYVRIRNRGCDPVPAGAGYLHLYYSKASTGLSWPNSWAGSSHNAAGGLNDQGEITAAANPFWTPALSTLPSIPSGGSIVVSIPWEVPMPSGLSVDRNHYCLLARITTDANPPYGLATIEGVVEDDNVRDNNNIIQKNVQILDAPIPRAPAPSTGGTYQGGVRVANIYDVSDRVRLRFDVPDNSNASVFEQAKVLVNLGPTLYKSWLDGGQVGDGVRPASTNADFVPTQGLLTEIGFQPGSNSAGSSGTSVPTGITTLEITRPGAWIGNIEMKANAQEQVINQFEFAKPVTAPQSFSLYMTQLSEKAGGTLTPKVIGGETYTITRKLCAKPVIFIQPSGAVALLQMSNSSDEEIASVNWYRDDQLVSAGGAALYVVPESGSYHVTVLYKSGCSASSDVSRVDLTPHLPYFDRRAGNPDASASYDPQNRQFGAALYPNPASQTSTLLVSLPDAGDVQIDVYDLRGCKVHAASFAQVPAGIRDFQIPAGSLAPGLYTVSVQSGTHRLTKKLTVVK